MSSRYIRRDEALDELWKNTVDTGINFSKYDDIKVVVKGENIPKPIEKFSDAGFSPLLKSNIQRANYSNPTPVQKYAISIIKEQRDLMACAQTGSGKTAAFLFPMLDRLMRENPRGRGSGATPQVVIMAPTRELVTQTYDEARKFSGGSDLMVANVYGGTSVFQQLQALDRGCNVLVATPGRLLDFVERGKISFESVQYLVLDEADRMLDMGFKLQIDNCVNHRTMSRNRVTLMFSATFPVSIQSCAMNYLDRSHLFLQVGIVGGACSDVRQTFHDASAMSRGEKMDKLVEMLTEMDSNHQRTLIFVETKKLADVVAGRLSDEERMSATSMHGDRSQEQRETALDDFRRGKHPILVATSVAARGLDINDIRHVINFEMPKEAEEYVHRIGRTGRVGNTGRATSFVDTRADSGVIPQLVNILVDAGQPVPDWMARGGGGYGRGGGRPTGGDGGRGRSNGFEWSAKGGRGGRTNGFGNGY